MFEIIEANISINQLKERFKSVIREIEKNNENLLDMLVLCCFVHRCRTPVNMDMLLAFFKQKIENYKDIYNMNNTLGSMLTDYFGELADSEQDHFVPRSTIVAESILKQVRPKVLKRVVLNFTKNVSRYRISRFDIFRRKAYDANLMTFVFQEWEEGRDFYELVHSFDNNNPYLRQQGALYLAYNRKFKEAFRWIDEAIVMSKGAITSIRNSHAIILFKANIDSPDGDSTVQTTLEKSMDILKECYTYDKRKTYHALTFAEQSLLYLEKYPNQEGAIEYLKTANI